MLKINIIVICSTFLFLNCNDKRSEYEKLSLDKQLSKQRVFLSNIKRGDEYIESIKLLLDDGVPVNCKDKYGFPATHIAMLKHNPKTVLLLLEYGADINAHDKDSATILHYAAAGGYPSIVKVLIDRGADVNAKAIHDLTPALNAAGLWMSTYDDSLNLIWEYLINAGINTNEVDIKGNSALLRAVFESQASEGYRLKMPQMKDGGEHNYIADDVRMHGEERNLEKYSKVLMILKPLLEKGADPLLKNIESVHPLDFTEKKYLQERINAKHDTLRYDKDPDEWYINYSAMMLFKESVNKNKK